MVAQHQHPGIEGAGDDGGEMAGAGDQRQAFALVMRDGCGGGGDTLSANQTRHRLADRMDEHDGIAAHAVHVRLDHLQHEAGRDGGVERIAAFLQHAHADLRGQPMRGRNDAEGTGDFGARGEIRRKRWRHGKSFGIEALL